MEWLFDTNVLVYRFDGRYPDKQRRARQILRVGLSKGLGFIPHQALMEFLPAVTHPLGPSAERGLLEESEAVREMHELLLQFPILYPDGETLRIATSNLRTHKLNWFDAHLLAYAGQNDCTVLCSEDFQHDRYYGTVQVINPFLSKLPGE